MTKKIIVIFSFIIVIFLAGCQEKVTPEDRLKDYVGFWNKKDFAKMYDEYLDQQTKETFSTESFVQRQEKLYEDLDVEKIKVTYTKPPTGTEWDPEKPATFPIQVKLHTIAGPVEFEKTMTLQYEKVKDKDNWYVEWDPSFIFPELGLKDEVRVSKTEWVRGEILDRNGKPIAVNGTGFEVGIVPGKFTDETKKKTLAELLRVTTAYIDKQLNQS